MDSVGAELWVGAEGLRAQAVCCESLGDRLAANAAPTATGSSVLSSAAAVTAAHAVIEAVGARCTSRIRATATALAVAAAGYVDNEAGSAARFRALAG